MVAPYVRAALAAAAAGALLTTSTPGYAAWHQAVVAASRGATIDGGTVSGEVTVPGEVTSSERTARTGAPVTRGAPLRAAAGHRLGLAATVALRAPGTGGVLRVVVPETGGQAPDGGASADAGRPAGRTS